MIRGQGQSPALSVLRESKPSKRENLPRGGRTRKGGRLLLVLCCDKKRITLAEVYPALVRLPLVDSFFVMATEVRRVEMAGLAALLCLPLTDSSRHEILEKPAGFSLG